MSERLKVRLAYQRGFQIVEGSTILAAALVAPGSALAGPWPRQTFSDHDLPDIAAIDLDRCERAARTRWIAARNVQPPSPGPDRPSA
ncbi:hypothetical protein NKH36_33675 [Mesorhizobium sp. M1312]|uniref:hypothetical protein n=1 Tax=unclassified Mesorhizobium TaxID=325217 RepID=UPI0033394131